MPFLRDPTVTNAIIHLQDQPSQMVMETMGCTVAATTRNTYNNENVHFIIHLYDKDCDRFILNEVLEDFHKAHELDKQEECCAIPTRRVHLRRCIKESLLLVNRRDKFCPIVLPQITFGMFTNYLMERKKWNKKLNCSEKLSRSAYNGCKSALMFLFSESGQEMDSAMKNELNIFMKALKKQLATEKKESGTSMDEGKRPMSFEVYKLLAETMFRSNTSDSLFAHTFLVLEWNLMSRAHMIAEMSSIHIEWKQDCLIFFFGKSKTNQEGEDAERPFHVYSNPLNPAICPVRALATYLAAYSDVLKGGRLLFPGSFQYNRFMKCMGETIEKHPGIRALGVTSGMLGSHSARKGAITLVTTGCIISPPMAATCIRAGWSMGQVKDRYIHYEKAGDQFVGRSVTGISSLNYDFAVSPAYWDWTDTTDQGAAGIALVKHILSSTIACQDQVAAPTFYLLQFLLAAVVCHRDYLDKNLHVSNPFLGSPAYMAVCEHFDQLKMYATTKFPWEATAFTPLPTGIPPHVLLLNKLEAMEQNIEKQAEMVCGRVSTILEEQLDKRNVGGPEYEFKKHFEEISKSHFDKMKELMMQCFAKEPTGDDSQFSDGFGICCDEIDANNVLQSPVKPVALQAKRPQRVSLCWANCVGGKLRLLPEDYKFPTLTLQNLIVFWYCGDSSKKDIPPYRLVRGTTDLKTKSSRVQLSQMKKLMFHVERATDLANMRDDLIVKPPKMWTRQNCMKLYDAVKHFFRFPPGKGQKQRRYDQMAWKTYFNILMKRNGRLFGEKDGETAM